MPENPNQTLYTWVVVILIVIIAFFALISKSGNSENILGRTFGLTNNRNVYLGFWTEGLWDDSTKSLNPERLKNLENKIGKKAAIAHYFRGWQHLGNENEVAKELTYISNSGWTPMISTNPYFFDECPSNGKTLYKAISEGDCDTYLHKIGKSLSKVEKPFFLRFAWEMNVDSMEWSVNRTNSSPEEFINAWRRFHTILKEEKVKNVIWVFSPQVESPTTTDIAKLYPGDAYVDWVGLDGYNWGTTQSWSTWQDFHSVFFDSYNKLANIAPTKPFMLAEVNTVSSGGDQGNWYRAMLSDEIPNVFTNIDAIVFFEDNKSAQEGVTWQIDITPESLNAFKKAISNSIYKSDIL